MLSDFGSFLAQRRNNPAEAETYFRRAIACDPGSVRPKRRLANHLYCFGGDLVEAEALHREVARHEPSAKLTGNLVAHTCSTFGAAHPPPRCHRHAQARSRRLSAPIELAPTPPLAQHTDNAAPWPRSIATTFARDILAAVACAWIPALLINLS